MRGDPEGREKDAMGFVGTKGCPFASRSLPGREVGRRWEARESGGCTTGYFLSSLRLGDSVGILAEDVSLPPASER